MPGSPCLAECISWVQPEGAREFRSLSGEGGVAEAGGQSRLPNLQYGYSPALENTCILWFIVNLGNQCPLRPNPSKPVLFPRFVAPAVYCITYSRCRETSLFDTFVSSVQDSTTTDETPNTNTVRAHPTLTSPSKRCKPIAFLDYFRSLQQSLCGVEHCIAPSNVTV